MRRSREAEALSRKAAYTLIAAFFALSAFGAFQLYVYLNPQLLREDFEGGFGGWVSDADVPQDPNNPGHAVEWNVACATGTPRSGQHSVKFFIDGRQDDGTLWIEKSIDVKRNSQIRVTVSFELHSEQESFNTIAVACAYVGIRNPEGEEDFIVLGPANQVAGWKRYSLSMPLDTGSSQEMWVALGISVRWETLMTYHVDDAEIEIR